MLLSIMIANACTTFIVNNCETIEGDVFLRFRISLLTGAARFVYDSCMSKTITIDDDVYKLLSSLKQDNGDSFTKVLRRHVHKPADTAGELLDAYDNELPPKVEPLALRRLLNQRGRRSGGRK